MTSQSPDGRPHSESADQHRRRTDKRGIGAAGALTRVTTLVTSLALLAGAVAVMAADRESTAQAILSMRPLVPYLILLSALCIVGVFFVPPWFVRRRIGAEEVATEKVIEAENSLRSSLFQAIGSALLVLGFVVTWQQLDQSRDQAERTNNQTAAQLELTRNGQVAERFARAMEQLASDRVDVRVGGIYALESLLEEFEAEQRKAVGDSATESDEDVRAARRTSSAIVEILLAYVRTRTGLVPGAPARATAHDVQAVLTILGRHAGDVPMQLSLARADLRGYRLAGCVSADQCARFDKTDFSGSDLRGVDFIESSLTTSVFVGANLEQARLQQTRLTDASFAGANLSNTTFSGADLTRAVLQDAVLTRTDLSGANLDGADFCGAKLVAADLSTATGLTTARLRGAIADQATRWPPGFNPRQAGVQPSDTPSTVCGR
jgi:uncharacterized protein YjbI with pentapeptide repeats